MAVFHVHAATIMKDAQRSAAGQAGYFTRQDRRAGIESAWEASGHPIDLIAWGEGGLPGWAKDAAHFWKEAQRWERHRGVIARTYQITLPRELSEAGREALTADIMQAYFATYPHTWALHCPQASDGRAQPHVHIMFNTRRDDGMPRKPSDWFARAANSGQAVASGGVRKDRLWNERATLLKVREGIAVLTNAALEREGVERVVWHTSLKARGIQRQPELRPGDPNIEEQARRHQHYTQQQASENTQNLVAWRDYKRQMGIADVRRETVIAYVQRQLTREREPQTIEHMEVLNMAAAAILKKRQGMVRTWNVEHEGDLGSGGAHYRGGRDRE